ncbi:MAG: MFS transporter [Coprobacillaceae bacterium]
MEKKKITKYCITYFIGYIVFAMAYGQYVTYLSAVGYSTSERGFMISAYAVTTIVFQLLLGYLTDKFQKVKQIFIISLLLYALSSMLLFSMETRIFVLHLILVALSGGLVNANFGIMDNWLFSNGKEEVENFSFIRAFGSAGWALACIVAASIINVFGYSTYGMISLVLAILVSALVLWSTTNTNTKKEKGTGIRIQDINILFKNKKYLVLTAVLFLVYCATTTNGSVVIDKMLELGATHQDIGIKWAINGGAEIPIYFIGARILRKLGSYKLLVISAILVSLQYFLFMCSNSVFSILLISGMQMFTGPLVMLSSRKLYYELAPENLRATSLLVAVSVYQGLSMLLMPTVCGLISQHIGVNVSLAFVSGLAFIGIVFALYLYKIQKNEALIQE